MIIIHDVNSLYSAIGKEICQHASQMLWANRDTECCLADEHLASPVMFANLRCEGTFDGVVRAASRHQPVHGSSTRHARASGYADRPSPLLRVVKLAGILFRLKYKLKIKGRKKLE